MREARSASREPAPVAAQAPRAAVAPRPVRSVPLLAAVAAVSVAAALGWSMGFLDLASLALASIAAVATVAAGLLARKDDASGASYDVRWPVRILGVGIALSVAYDAVVAPGVYVRPELLGGFRPVLLAFGALAATYAWPRPPTLLARLRFPLLVGAAAALGALVIRASPRPSIDVWYFEQFGSTAILQGVNPYAVAYPNIYGPLTPSYAAAVLSSDRAYVLGNPYPPLTLLLGLPTALLGSDVRWTMLALVIVSAWGIRRIGRGSTGAELAALFLLVQPRALFVLEQSWTEPTVLAATLLTVVAIEAWSWRAAVAPDRSAAATGWLGAGLTAAVALGSKQYAPMILAPLLFATPRHGRGRALVVAVAGAAAIAAPFVLWDGAAFYRSVVAFQLEQPFRADALSWLSAVAGMGGPVLPVWPAFVLAAATLALAIRRTISLEHAILAGAGAWLVLVLFNKQAFCNYYWLAIGLLCAAVAACSGLASHRSAAASPSRGP